MCSSVALLWGYGDHGFLHGHFSCPISFFTCIAPRITALERLYTSSFHILYLLCLCFIFLYLFCSLLFLFILVYCTELNGIFSPFFFHLPGQLCCSCSPSHSLLPLASLSLQAQAAEMPLIAGPPMLSCWLSWS